MFAIGKQTQCAEMQLIEYSAQSNDVDAPLKCSQLHSQGEHQQPTQFSATFENQGSGTIYNTKYMLAIVKKTQCAEMQLIDYSAQSIDVAAPLKCRQLHIQREHQHHCSFQLPLKTKVLAPFTTLGTCSL